ncbi:lysine N(6)-hydroxylase/L-ornithine N(5)-oxygenase family protein [Methylobacter sp. Wu8]|uniref:lysine N(6)-hydroxylase/L-ornithine N(5)-oxygenase family protein n=1 Tax=Methylobacter sp. Wu8 TaxID=3118457 RepID=UPI002F2C9C98
MREITYDVIGIGVGPFNLSLACLMQPIEGLNSLFLDKSQGFNWHPGILLQDAHLQTPFLSDLVTLADPTSPFSFLNYIKQQGRIYSFYIRENFFLMRSEYNQYCQWAASKLDNVAFNTHVGQIEYDESLGCYVIQSQCMKTGKAKTYRAKKLVLGTGTLPYTPACCLETADKSVHSSQYLRHKKTLQRKKSITVLGSGQSAAEIVYDLLQDIDSYGYELSWITRSPRFYPLEYSKLTLEMTSPEYVDYFYQLPAHKRERLIAGQKNLYKGINGSLINDIYDLMYVKRLSHDFRVNLLTNSELKAAEFNAGDGRFELEFFQDEQETGYSHRTEGLVLATGYSYQLPAFIDGIASRIQRDPQARFAVNRNYSIDPNGDEIFVQNVGLHTHGFVTPDLGMVCYRNACIIKAVTGQEHYPIEQSIAFQRFSAPEEKVSAVEPSGVLV